MDRTTPIGSIWIGVCTKSDFPAANIEAHVARLREHGARFRNDIITGVSGMQVLVEDPAGNPVELFQPTRAEAKLSGTS